MRRTFRKAMLLAVFLSVPVSAWAGWVAEWTNVATKPNGDKADPQPSSMTIAGNQVRLEQADAITMIDYNTGTYTLLNPQRHSFWRGTVDEYVRQVARSRADAMRQKLIDVGRQQEVGQVSDVPAKVDPAKLPPVSIANTGVTEKIAGYDTAKYDVKVDGELFQELWVAPVDVSADLDFNRFLAQQRKISAGMVGRAATQYNAVYASDEYRKLLEKTFVLKMKAHHLGGGFERTATSIKQTEVAPTQFQVPEAYRKVNLSDVMPKPPAPEPQPQHQQLQVPKKGS